MDMFWLPVAQLVAQKTSPTWRDRCLVGVEPLPSCQPPQLLVLPQPWLLLLLLLLPPPPWQMRNSHVVWNEPSWDCLSQKKVKCNLGLRKKNTIQRPFHLLFIQYSVFQEKKKLEKKSKSAFWLLLFLFNCQKSAKTQEGADTFLLPP